MNMVKSQKLIAFIENVKLPYFPIKVSKNNDDLIVDGENLLNDCNYFLYKLNL